MKYKAGDRVRIVSKRIEGINGMNEEGLMDKYLGTIMTIKQIEEYNGYPHYDMEEDRQDINPHGHNLGRGRYDNMIEGLVEEHKDEYKEGDIVLVRDEEEHKWEEKIYLYKTKYNQYLCTLEVDGEKYKKGEIISAESRKYIKPLPKHKEMTIKDIEKELGYSIKVIK